MNTQKRNLPEIKRKAKIKNSVSSENLLHLDSPLSFLVDSFSGAIALYEFDFENSHMKRLRGNDNFFAAFNISKKNRRSYEGNIIDLIHPEDCPAILKALMNLKVKGKTHKTTLRMRCKESFDTNSYQTLNLESHVLARTEKNLSIITIFKGTDENIIKQPKTQVNFTNSRNQQLGTHSSVKKTGLFTMNFNDNYRLVYANDSFFEICEISREEGEKRADTILHDILYPEDRQHVFNRIEKNLVSGELNFECYVRILSYKKNPRVVGKVGKIRKESNGTFIDVVVTDLTDVSIGHGRLEPSEAKLQNILSGSAVTVWDIKKKSCMWSKEIQLAFGVPAETESLVDTLCAPNMLRDDSAELLKNIIQRLIRGEFKFSITEYLWFDKQDNKSVCRRMTFFVENNENDEIIKISVIGQDVAKEVLDIEYTGIEKIVESMPGGILVVDSETEILRYANDDYFKIIGFTRDELKNQFSNIPRNLIQSTRQNTPATQMVTEMKNAGRTTFEGQAICSGGKKIWVHSEIKCIGKNFFCIVTDITNQKRIISELKNEQLFQQMANDITDDIIFRFDIQADTVQYVGRAIENFNPQHSLENYPASVIDRGVIYNEDVSIFVTMVENMIGGKEIPCELRLKDIHGRVEWYRVEYQIAFENEKPIYAVGKIINIEKEKGLAVHAAIDSLTGCFNPDAIKISIQQILDGFVEGMQHAFIIINIDNFKNINDTLGRIKGDSVLKEFALRMKKNFRGSDFIGRIGGDEFVIFMCEYGDSSALRQKMGELVKILQSTYSCMNTDYFVSASIGVATYPENGRSYEDLYNNADFALCEAKGRGKNQFCMFSPGRSNR